MIQFEVGKRYVSSDCVKYTVRKRSAVFITLESHIPGATKPEIFRKKFIIADDKERINLNNKYHYILANWTDDSQQDLPATADDAISATGNDSALASQPAAVATAECETSAQPKIVKFVVGKTYACIHSVCGMDWTGYKKNNYLCKYTIIARKGKFVTVRDELGDTAKRLLKTDNNGVEFIHPSGYYASFKHLVLFANAPTVEPEITPTAESSRPENLYMDDSFSDAPGDNSECARNQDFPVDIPECTHAEIAQQEKYTFIIGNVYISPDNRPFTVFNRSENFIILADEHGKTLTRKIYTSSYCEAVRLEKFSVGSLFLSAISMKKDNIYADNPGFTIVPSEHIERPQYTAYPEPIIDECPYTTVYACDIPENTPRRNPITEAKFKWINQFLLAVFFLCKFIIPVLSMRKNDLKNTDSVETIPAETLEITPKPAPQKLTCFSAFIDWEYCNMLRRKNKAIIDACDSEEGIIALMLTLNSTDILRQASYCRVKLHTNIPHSSDIKTDEQLAREFATAIIARRAKKARKAEKLQTSKISPDPASATADIEHKLIDTQNLHFAEKRKALEHNTTVITSCMFPEAVISLLLSISAKAVIHLGFHMRLFIAKPKGSKKAIAESFAQRLITRRDIHANVRTMSANTDAKNTANVPDGVKIFLGARRQICFKFED